MRKIVPCLLAALAALGACGAPAPEGSAKRRALEFDLPGDDSAELREDRSVYDRDNLNEVPVINLTVWDLEGFARVNSNNPPDAEVGVRFQQGSFGEGTPGVNGQMMLRGTSTRLAILKSYKIKLTDEAGRWRDQKTIHLLKNPWDLTRVRNYAAWEFFKITRHMTSMRHQYVQVFINGQDYGLYEWFESSSKRFLESHGLDEDGQLYKGADFTYQPYKDNLFDCVDPREQCLEIEENHDAAKVKRMLDAVNDMSQDINDIIDTYFERNNYETWLATEILFSNYDSASQNWFIYSPHDSERWYYLPWDYNGAFGFREQPDWRIHPRDRALNAPGYWWKVLLHRRFLSDPSNVRSLHDRILALRTNPILDSEMRRIQARVHDTVRTFVSRPPDLNSLPVSDWSFSPEQKLAEWEAEWARIGGLISKARHDFEESVEWPMPAWIGSARRLSSTRVRFRWDESHDLQGDGLTYDVALSRTPQFAPGDVIARRTGLSGTEVELSPVPPGIYYFSLSVRDDSDPDEHWVTAFNRYHNIPANRMYPGVKRFEIP